MFSYNLYSVRLTPRTLWAVGALVAVGVLVGALQWAVGVVVGALVAVGALQWAVGALGAVGVAVGALQAVGALGAV